MDRGLEWKMNLIYSLELIFIVEQGQIWHLDSLLYEGIS